MSSSSGISFSGLFSNLDTESIITQLMYIERAPVRLLEQKQKKLGFEKDSLQTVNTSLLALRNAIKSFKTDGMAYDNTVTSEDESILTGSANAAATEGTYQVTVTDLAIANIVSSSTKPSGWVFGDESAGGLGGVLRLRMENDTPGLFIDVNILATDTLANITTKINTATNGVDNFSDYGKAELITDPATGNQTILVKASEAGTAHRITLNNQGNLAATVIGFRTPLPANALNEIKTAQDASIDIDGVPITSSTNLVEGAIAGVSLNLHSTGGPIEVRVGLNNDDIVQKASDFVKQFNATTDMMVNYISEKPVQDPQNESDLKTGILFGDMDLVATKSEIRMKTTGYVDAGLADYRLLSQIGIQSEASYGSYVSNDLVFDEDTFRTALADNKDEVIALMEGWANNLDKYLEAQTKVSVIESDAGNFYRRMLSIDDRVGDIDNNISNWEERLQSMEDRMRAQYTAMEEALQKLQSQSTYLSSQLSSLQAASKSNS